MPHTIDPDALTAFAARLIEISTENPPGGSFQACVDLIGEELTRLGIAHQLVQTGTDDDPRTTIVASGGTAGPLLYLHGHYDVVPAFDSDQFRPRRVDDRLIGRGASDMKGGLAAIVHAVPCIADAGARVRLVIVPDEETGGGHGSHRLKALGVIDPSASGAILAEPTWGTIWHAARGAFTLRVTARGAPAHVGLHYLGRNAFTDAVSAVARLAPLQAALKDRRSELAFNDRHPRAAESIMLVGGQAGGGTNFNIVPSEFSFTIDRRPNADEDYAAAKAELLAALEAIRRDGIPIEWEVMQDARSSFTAPDAPFVQVVRRSVESAVGAKPSVTCCPGVLETRVYTAAGIPAVAFGPGLIEEMHSPSEYVPVANLVAAADAYVEIARSLASRKLDR